MHSGDVDKTKVGKICSGCGQLYDPTIAFCPKDGTKLSGELVTADSQDIVLMTGTHTNIDAKADADKKDATPGRGMQISQPKKTEPPIGNKTATLSMGANARQGAAVPPLEISGSHAESLVGKVIDDHYEVISIVGKGGMSIVYQAKDVRLNKLVAIKTLLPHLVLHPLSNQRFQQEARAASNISHQNVVGIYNFGSTPEGQPFLVMDFLEGVALSAIIQDGKIDLQRALHIFNQVTDALATAHEKGVIHRDLKPSNILLVNQDNDPDHVKIVDFGIAKLLPQEGMDAVSLTQTGDVFGSPLYMSPEQCKGEKLDARADIYSMGCLMFETLTGKPPYPGDNTLEVLYKHINEGLPSFKEAGAKVPEKLEAIALRCLAKDPMQRYQNMRALQEDLLKFQYDLKGSFLHKMRSRWQIFWLRRKPRTLREKAVFAIAVFGLFTTLLLGTYLADLYLAANNSPMLKEKMVWKEDENKRVTKNASGEEIAVADLAIRMARNYSDEGLETKNEAIGKLSARAAELSKKDYWSLVAKIYKHALEMTLDLNGRESFQALDMNLKLADAYYNDANWKDAVNEYSRVLAYRNDPYMSKLKTVFPHCAFRIGNIYYFQNQPARAVEYYNAAYVDWTHRGKANDYGEALNHLMKDNLADETELALCTGRLGDCLASLADAPSGFEKSNSDDLLRSALQMYLRSASGWNELRGKPNADGVVATAKALKIERRLKTNSPNLDQRYQDCLKDMNQQQTFADKPIYTALLLVDYADYLWQNNQWFQAMATRLQAGNIIARQKMAQ